MKEGVPTNPEKRTKLALCGSSPNEIQSALNLSKNDSEKGIDTLRQGSSANNPLRQRSGTISEIESISRKEWNILLGDGKTVSPLQLLYSLQIVNDLVFPEGDGPNAEPSQTQQSQAMKYGRRFIRSGGFTHLYHILNDSDISKFGDDALSKKCLVSLLRLFNHFYNLLDANESLTTVVHGQMSTYGINSDYKDLIPRLLQVVHTIAKAANTTTTTSSSSSVASGQNKEGNQNINSNKLDNSNQKNGRGNKDSRGDNSNTLQLVEHALQLSIEARTVENATSLLVSFVNKTPSLMHVVYDNALTKEALLYALIDCSDCDVRSELGRGINKLCMSDDSQPNNFFIQLLLDEGLKKTKSVPSSKTKEYFLLVDTLLKNSPTLKNVEFSDVAKVLTQEIQESVVVQVTENDSDPRLNGLMSCLMSLLAR